MRGAAARITARRRADLIHCYQDVRRTHPKARGQYRLDVTVGKSGRVLSVQASLPNPVKAVPKTLLKCAANKVKRWKFPVAKTGCPIRVVVGNSVW